MNRMRGNCQRGVPGTHDKAAEKVRRTQDSSVQLISNTGRPMALPVQILNFRSAQRGFHAVRLASMPTRIGEQKANIVVP
jgi:hypothetical protein